jgi:hypothetical protein
MNEMGALLTMPRPVNAYDAASVVLVLIALIFGLLIYVLMREVGKESVKASTQLAGRGTAVMLLLFLLILVWSLVFKR